MKKEKVKVIQVGKCLATPAPYPKRRGCKCPIKADVMPIERQLLLSFRDAVKCRLRTGASVKELIARQE